MSNSVHYSLCYCCLQKNTEVTLFRYTLKNKTLKILLQLEILHLCYVCLKIAKYAEQFIAHLLDNHKILEAFKENTQALDGFNEKPIITLTHIKLDIVQPDITNCENEAFSILFKHGSSRKDVKKEIKDEGICDGFYEVGVEDEDDLSKPQFSPELESLKAIKTENNHRKNKKSKKTKKIRKILKAKKNIDTTIDYNKEHNIIIRNDNMAISRYIHLTQNQIAEERKDNAKNPKYLESSHKCEDCLKGFAQKETYIEHLKKHTQGDYECDICKQRRCTEKEMIQHMRNHCVRFKCDVCGILRASHRTIKEHYHKHHSNATNKMYQCSHCTKTYNHYIALKKHLSYIKRTRNKVMCNECSKEFASKDYLSEHMLRKHPDTVTKFAVPKRHECVHCGEKFRSLSRLKYHSIKHSEKREHYCVECDKTFKSEAILNNHLRTASTHVKYLDLPFSCAQCDKRFSCKRDLTNHLNRLHLNVRPHKCGWCEKAYVTAYSLKEHVRKAHEGYKRPLDKFCTMCDKVFDHSSTLKAHIRTHTGERPYQCGQCQANFSQSGVLATHVKLVHLKLTRDGKPKAAKT